MDWDGIGSFALFISAGSVGLGLIALRAYTARLKAMLERERIRADAGFDADLREEVSALREQVRRLGDRADFTDRLLQTGEAGDPEE